MELLCFVAQSAQRLSGLVGHILCGQFFERITPSFLLQEENLRYYPKIMYDEYRNTGAREPTRKSLTEASGSVQNNK